MEQKNNVVDEVINITCDEDPFTMYPNELLINTDISPNARLLYGIIKYYIRIPNFKIYKTTLRKAIGLSKDTFDKYWKELKDFGLLEQTREHVDGRWKYKYKLHSKIQYPKNKGIVQDPKKQDVEKQDSCNTTPCNMGEYNNTQPSNNLHSNNEPNNVVVPVQVQDIYEQLSNLIDGFKERYAKAFKNEIDIFTTASLSLAIENYKAFIKTNINRKGIELYLDLDEDTAFEMFVKFKRVTDPDRSILYREYSRIDNPTGFIINEFNKLYQMKVNNYAKA